ncbi:MAG: carbonic anhydrase, partial [Bythopirellula sp.]
MAGVSSASALSRLKAGNKRYVADKMKRDMQDPARRSDLTSGQSPFAIVLSCADSRVVPELIFDQGLGELFVVRVAGNVANTSSIASIEYAAANLGSKLIVVLGHESCGAVTAAMEMVGVDYGYNINHLLAHIAPALASTRGKQTVEKVVKQNARLNAKLLLERSPI